MTLGERLYRSFFKYHDSSIDSLSKMLPPWEFLSDAEQKIWNDTMEEMMTIAKTLLEGKFERSHDMDNVTKM